MLPILPLRDRVFFPNTVSSVFVGRVPSIAAVTKAMKDDTPILLVSQKDAKLTEPTAKDLYSTGCLAKIIQSLNLPDGSMKLLLEATDRVIVSNIEMDVYLKGDYVIVTDKSKNPDKTVQALLRNVRSNFEKCAKLNKSVPVDLINSLDNKDDLGAVCDIIINSMNIKFEDKQKFLETTNVVERAESLIKMLMEEIEIFETEARIQQRMIEEVQKSQKQYYLHEQINALQKELGEEEEDESKEIQKQIEQEHLPKEVQTRLKKELKKLKKMQPMSAEATVSRNYIDVVTSLPWAKLNQETYDVKKAEGILDKDHYGLEKVKERILEYIAIKQLSPNMKPNILCFQGSPGTGKTTIARSVAASLNKEFHRISLGGVRDESEIRGHRRTYVGSMPGKIIQTLRKCKTNNPVILLDEIDKMGSDHKGDPAAALLEILDPEQNKTFVDHYLELEYDLSNITFIATSNDLRNVPRPLLDRMEIIELDSYTDQEKFHICKSHLIPRAYVEFGLTEKNLKFSDSAIKTMIDGYTRESGVRNLTRVVSSVCRKVVKKIVKNKNLTLTLNETNITKLLGPKVYKSENIAKKAEVGVTNGLAWTQVGGDILKVEVVAVKGSGRIITTGKLGETMRESCSIALTAVQNKLKDKIKLDLTKHDLHIHFPDGATPKDGPSAGVTLVTSLTSLFLNKPVPANVAMTGEVSITGKVLAIGGLKEKVIAAYKGGVKTVICPIDNKDDLKDIPKEVRSKLKIVTVDNVDKLLKTVLGV